MRKQIKEIKFGITFLMLISMFSQNAVTKEDVVSKEAVARTESKTVDAWQVVCNFGKNDQKLGCAAILKVTQQKTEKDKTQENVVMLWQIGKGQNGSLVSTIQTPTGVVIKPGVQLKVPSAQAITFPFVSCDRQACFAGSEMDDNLLKQAVTAQKVDIALQAIDGRVYTYSFSPKGIDKAIQAVK